MIFCHRLGRGPQVPRTFVTAQATNTKERTRRGWEERYPWFRERKGAILTSFINERKETTPQVWATSFEAHRKMFFGRDTQPQQARLVEVLDTISAFSIASLPFSVRLTRKPRGSFW